MVNIEGFIKKLHKFDAKTYFEGNESSVQKIMACKPKECLGLGIPMNNILQIYEQSIIHLNQDSRLDEICRSIVDGLHEMKASHIETDFI